MSRRDLRAASWPAPSVRVSHAASDVRDAVRMILHHEVASQCNLSLRCRFNVAGAVLWTVLFVGAGFFFGNLPFVQARAAARATYSVLGHQHTDHIYAAPVWLAICVSGERPICACAA